MMSSDFFKNNGRPVPQIVQKLGTGFGNLSGQAFPESVDSLNDADEQRFDLEPERDKDGKYSMGTVAKFEHEDGRIAFVTKHNGKFHVNVLKNGVPYLPAATYDDKEVATAKAEGLLKREDARRVPEDWHVYDASGKEQRCF